jgi:eukaryotic-like serine/threonine-protein kinase
VKPERLGTLDRSVPAGYAALDELGRGAAATVLRVRRAADGCVYALKVLDSVDAETAADMAALAAFRREAALLACVDHPGLVRIHEVDAVAGRPYLVMDLVEGESLADVLARGPLPPGRVVALALDLIDPLTAVHNGGLVHRDLKPENIMIRPDGRAQLIDFGLAARDAARDAGRDAAGSADGAAGTAVGTLIYAPPEQSGLLRRPVDNRSDLYSLGVVLFECLTGAPPFTGPDVGELLRMHAVTPAPDLRELVPGIPPGLAAAVAALLAKDPDDRYQHGAELAADLRMIGADADGPFVSSRATLGPDAGGRAVMVGRAAELALLTRRWAAARGDGDSDGGGVCVVRGGGGVGKSRLASELAALAGASGAVVLHASPVADDPVPLAPLRHAIDRYLAAAQAAPPQARAAALDRIRACAGAAAPLLATLSPALARACGDVPAAAESVTEDRQDQFTTAVAGFLTALAESAGGALLVVDDPQWLDPGSRRVLARLAADLAGVPLLVVVTARTGDAAAEEVVAAFGSAVDLEVTLESLDHDDVAELIRLLVPGSGEELRLLVSRAGGNPMVVREYVRAVVDAGLLRPSWGRWVLDEDGLDALALPQDALGLLLTRLHDLSPEHHALLATAALMGAVFRPDVLERVHGGPVMGALNDAVSRGLLEPRDGGTYAFLHNGIRDALAAGLDAADVARQHAATAAALESLEMPRTPEHVYSVAHHYLSAGATAPVQRAFPACVAAGELALRQHAPAEAVHFLTHAVDLTANPDARLLVPLGTALKQLGRFTDAAERFEAALAIEPDPLRRAETLVLLADVHRATWNLEAGLAVASRGLAELGVRVPRNGFAMAVTTAVRFVLAVLMQWTGWGFGTARGDQRRRCNLVAALHSAGAYHNALQMRLGLVTVHILHGLYWANRVGEGLRYGHGQVSIGTVAAALGMRRVAAAAYARAMADPAARQPTEHALWSYHQALAGWNTNHDDFGDPGQILQDEGHWMDLASYAEAVGNLVMSALAEGRNEEAARWWARGERRLAQSTGERTALYSVPPLLAAANGQHAESAAHLSRIEREHEGLKCAGLTATRTAARIFALYEQGETGRPFDDAVSEYLAAGFPPAMIPRGYRVTLFHIAMGRVEQCRPDGADRAERIARARAAVATIGKGARDNTSRSWRRIAAANLLVITGEPRKALRELDADETIHRPAAPLIAFERARIRSRAYRALDALDDARGQARLALVIADENDWPHRVAWILAEFPELRAAARGTAHASVSLAASTDLASTRIGDSLAARGIDRQRLAALQHIGAAASRVLDPEALARIALDETIRLLRAERAVLFLVDETGDRLVSHLGRDAAGADVAHLTGYSASLVERVRVTREPLVITGTEEGAALGAESVVLHGLRSIMVAPLMLDERLLGVVYLDSQVAKGIFTADDAGILIALTTHIATSLETARAAQLEISMRAAQRQRDLAEKMREAFEEMTDTLDPAAVLDRLLRWTSVMVPNDGVWLVTPDGGGQVLIESGDPPVRHPVPAREAVPAPDQPVTLAGSEIPPVLARQRPDGASWALLPLRSRRTDVARRTDLGVLAVASSEPEERLAQEIEIAAALVAQGLTAYDNASLFAQVRELAVIDELTGVPNRRRFFELAERECARARRQARPFIAMMLDIDHFKRVNDTLGHPTGDDVIRVVANRLADGVRRTDVLGRYGGEEFSVLLPDADITAGHELAERLRRAIGEKPVATRSGPLGVTVSIGLSLWTPDDPDVATVLARADRALYEAKRDGRNRTAVSTGED